MHTIEPYFNWRQLYQASEDPRSPFFGYFNSEVYYTDTIYDHVIHPQWDSIGCETLFLKVLYVFSIKRTNKSNFVNRKTNGGFLVLILVMLLIINSMTLQGIYLIFPKEKKMI